MPLLGLYKVLLDNLEEKWKIGLIVIKLNTQNIVLRNLFHILLVKIVTENNNDLDNMYFASSEIRFFKGKIWIKINLIV